MHLPRARIPRCDEHLITGEAWGRKRLTRVKCHNVVSHIRLDRCCHPFHKAVQKKTALIQAECRVAALGAQNSR